MTREEIEAKIRLENPTTRIGEDHYGPGDQVYEDLITEWVDAYEPPVDRKVWGTAHDFLLAFTAAEQAAISLSTDAGVAALRLQLMTWPGQVWTDDPRIIGGMDAIVSAGIIDETRRTELMTP